ncbi:hypothetical protein IFM89_004622 [Coptis chinensis]|uniref:Uncharacterized protein n=1 Tax=Coptis chinensis TaxID=261450 RepID=A0A835H6N6_9MAGN|nr:hypothetical protein IFM89_004622 [Coptis chinensis]
MACSSKKKEVAQDISLVDEVFSWSLEDVFNQELYKHKVQKIPDSFQSVDQYLGSYIHPLLEETHAELCSSMEVVSMTPVAEVVSLEEYMEGRGVSPVTKVAENKDMANNSKVSNDDHDTPMSFKVQTSRDLPRSKRA